MQFPNPWHKTSLGLVDMPLKSVNLKESMRRIEPMSDFWLGQT